ncbi:SDR family oxidoreductase [Clostridium swellfunianum]|uniref:SDR family oxidoreductase n=1 Tax=Clostridium swellfunianum TaxID=1367462 RepID=UPI00203038A9|nr:SDR family oxidoreductase [Clostridium swellfunianum]MCM0650195.1 SDR family oxidoreductase [Clostridium swellfunianum]
MKVLVTGATGNVGSSIVKELLARGENVVAATTNIEKIYKLFDNKVEPVYFDFTDNNTFNNALEAVDRVFLMRPPHLGKPEHLYPFIDAMKAHDIKLVSFLSLMGVENNTIPPHHKIEKYIEKLHLPYAHVRPGFFMQNLSGIHSVEIREKHEIFVPAGKSKTSFIDVADIGLATAILLHEPEKYKNTAHTITGLEALDYFQVADILSKAVGRKITYTKPGYLKYRNYYIKKRGLDKTYVNVTIALYFMTRMGTAKDITKDFYELTGRKPRTFEEFAKDNIKYFI